MVVIVMVGDTMLPRDPCPDIQGSGAGEAFWPTTRRVMAAPGCPPAAQTLHTPRRRLAPDASFGSPPPRPSTSPLLDFIPNSLPPLMFFSFVYLSISSHFHVIFSFSVYTVIQKSYPSTFPYSAVLLLSSPPCSCVPLIFCTAPLNKRFFFPLLVQSPFHLSPVNTSSLTSASIFISYALIQLLFPGNCSLYPFIPLHIFTVVVVFPIYFHSPFPPFPYSSPVGRFTPPLLLFPSLGCFVNLFRPFVSYSTTCAWPLSPFPSGRDINDTRVTVWGFTFPEPVSLLIMHSLTVAHSGYRQPFPFPRPIVATFFLPLSCPHSQQLGPYFWYGGRKNG